MENKNSIFRYLSAGLIGAAVGCVFMAYLTEALPEITSKMMRNMMENMKDEGCDPREI